MTQGAEYRLLLWTYDEDSPSNKADLLFAPSQLALGPRAATLLPRVDGSSGATGLGREDLSNLVISLLFWATGNRC
jgi:hypothetical protein